MDPRASDADFLLEFAPTARVGLEQFFGVSEALEQLPGRRVDLVERGAVQNPFLLKSIHRSREAVYAA